MHLSLKSMAAISINLKKKWIMSEEKLNWETIPVYIAFVCWSAPS